MKKGIKAALWAAAGCIAVGGILMGAGFLAGGHAQLEEVGGQDSLHHVSDWVAEHTVFGTAGWHGKEEKKGAAIYQGDFTAEIPGTQQVQHLEVELAVHSLIIEEGTTEAFVLEGSADCERIQCYVEDGTLYLQDVGKHKKLSGQMQRRITLTVPADFTWDTAELEADMGSVEADKLLAHHADLEVGMGNMIIHHAQLDGLEISADMGSVELSGTVNGNVDADADMGSIQLSGIVDGNVEADADMGSIVLVLQQQENDFNYHIESAMGSIVLNGEEYAGMSKELTKKYDAPRNMELESSMGTIEISFE